MRTSRIFVGGALVALLASLATVVGAATPGVTNLGSYSYASASAVGALVSCSSAGNCLAVGTNPKETDLALTSKVNGKWVVPHLVRAPGSGSLQGLLPNAVTCPSADNCSVVFTPVRSNGTPYFIFEKSGKWSSPVVVPGTASPKGLAGDVSALSCSGPGDCTLAVTSPADKGFIEHLVGGALATSTPLTFPKKYYGGTVSYLTCRGPATCRAGGTVYTHRDRGIAYNQFVFTMAEVSGRWSSPSLLGNSMPTSGVNGTAITELACPDQTQCAVAGITGTNELFASSISAGKWAPVHLLGAGLLKQGYTQLQVTTLAGQGSLSCANISTCALVINSSALAAGATATFAVSLYRGVWLAPSELMKTTTNLPGPADVSPSSLSCTTNTCQLYVVVPTIVDTSPSVTNAAQVYELTSTRGVWPRIPALHS